MGKVIAIANQKGGVGKTTTCVNLCCALKNAGMRVLLCDLDPQGNGTTGMGVDKKKVDRSVYDVLSGECDIAAATVKTKYGDLLPANAALSGAGIELVMAERREYVFKDALDKVKDSYDFVLIDCPPSLEMLTLNALCASDSVIIPVQCEYFALEGLTDLMTTIRLTKRKLNPNIEIEGVVLTMYDGRTNLSMQVADEVKRFFGAKTFSTVIPRNVRLSEAPSHKKPAIAYDYSSRGARAYVEFADEVMKRNGKRGVR